MTMCGLIMLESILQANEGRCDEMAMSSSRIRKSSPVVPTVDG